MNDHLLYNAPTKEGKFGKYGGKFVPETLISALIELEEAYYKLKKNSNFITELDDLQSKYNGRPTPLTFSKRINRLLWKSKNLSEARRFVPHRGTQIKQCAWSNFNC